MTIEERLKRIEDKLGMSWGCREPHKVDLSSYKLPPQVVVLGDEASQFVSKCLKECGYEVVSRLDGGNNLWYIGHLPQNPKRATIKIGPMHLTEANVIISVLATRNDSKVVSVTVSPDDNKTTLTITGPAAE